MRTLKQLCASPSVLTPLWALLASVFCLKVLLAAVTQTMFFDGLIYASLAHNMADGIGSVWRPHFSDTLFPLFSEHPPLMFWLLELLYRVFGDGIWVEKAFTVLTALISGLLFLGIWKNLTRDDPELKQLGMVPLILALIAGRLGWGFANNMLENGLIVFTSLAIYLILMAYGRPSAPAFLSRLPFILAAGVATALALLVKGPVGLFPLATPALYWIAFRKPSFVAVVLDNFVLLGAIVAVLALVFLYPEPRAYAQRYVDLQLFASLSGNRGGNGGGFGGVWTLVRVNLWPVLIWSLAFLAGRFLYPHSVVSAEGSFKARLRISAFFLMVAVSASVPILVSPRIHSFYFNPSLPYFAAAGAVFSAPILLRLLQSLTLSWLRRVTGAAFVLLLVMLIITGLNAGRGGEDDTVIADAGEIAAEVCAADGTCEPVAAACSSVWEDWHLHAYLQRRFRVSMEKDDTPPPVGRSYLIGDESCTPDASRGYRPVDIGLSRYRLFVRS